MILAVGCPVFFMILSIPLGMMLQSIETYYITFTFASIIAQEVTKVQIIGSLMIMVMTVICFICLKKKIYWGVILSIIIFVWDFIFRVSLLFYMAEEGNWSSFKLMLPLDFINMIYVGVAIYYYIKLLYLSYFKKTQI